MLNLRTLLFEDVARAKKILRDLNVPETDPRYTKLRKLLEKNIGYLGTFVNFMFNGKVEYDDLVALYERLQNEKALFAKLPKPFIEYQNFNELQDDLTRAAQEIKFQKAFKLFPKTVRDVLTRDMNNELRDRLISMSDEFIGVYDKLASKEGKSEEQLKSDQEELTTFYSGFALLTNNNASANQILDVVQQMINKHFAGKDYQEKIAQVKETNGAELLYTDPAKKLIVAAIYSFSASQKLGSPNWCICKWDSSWESYTTDRQQFFIWDYNYDNTNKYNIIGTTMNSNGSFYVMQDALNGEIKNTFGSSENYLNKIGLPIEVLKAPLEKLEQEKLKRKFEEIKSKRAEQVSQSDIEFLQTRFQYAEDMVDFIAKTYGKMPRFALSEILDMQAKDQKKIIPEILRTMKGKFVDEDDFYYMINTDNIARIYPDIDADKFRDTIIAYLKKARTPDEWDNALIYSYIIHNLDNFNDVMTDIGEDGLNKLTQNEIQYIINLAISKGNKQAIDAITRIGKMPKFTGKEYVDIMRVLYGKNIEQPVEKVLTIFGKDFIKDIKSQDVVEMILHLPDDLFEKLFSIAGDDLVKKIEPTQLEHLKRSEKYARIEKIVNSPMQKPVEPATAAPAPVVPMGNENTIYAELLKAKGKREIDTIVQKYGKAGLRRLSPSQVAKILKNTDHPDKLTDAFGRDLVEKALADPSGGSALKFKLNKVNINPDTIKEQDGFDFLGLNQDKSNEDIVLTKEFQVQFIYDMANNLKNTTDWRAVKEDGKVHDKYAGYSWNSVMEEYDFTYDYDGKLIPLRIWVDNKNPLFMTGEGRRFKIEMLNTEVGKKYKEIILRNLDKKQ